MLDQLYWSVTLFLCSDGCGMLNFFLMSLLASEAIHVSTLLLNQLICFKVKKFDCFLFCLIQWLCIESLLSIPHCACENGEISSSFFSDAAVRCIFNDLVDR